MVEPVLWVYLGLGGVYIASLHALVVILGHFWD